MNHTISVPSIPVESMPKSRWQESLKRAFRGRSELAAFLKLDFVPDQGDENDYGFRTLVTREFAARMQKGDWNDPLLRQVWPDPSEGKIVDGFESDPVGDGFAQIAGGLLQKYTGRVLMVMTGACAVHCRYCFRRHYPYSESPKSIDQWLPAVEHVRSDESIQEVILSGGDPLTIADDRLARLVALIEAIPHVERLRIHTRLPIVLPSRIDDRLLDWLDRSRLSKWIVVHCNHLREIDEDVVGAFRRIQGTGAVVLNQAVLLRGINDSEAEMESLCRELIRHAVVPYYLHALDRVHGAAHFEVEVERGRQIMEHLRRVLPGYAVPKFVREIAGEPSKSPIADGKGELKVEC